MLPVGEDQRPGTLIDGIVQRDNGRNGGGRGGMVFATQSGIELFFGRVDPILSRRGR